MFEKVQKSFKAKAKKSMMDILIEKKTNIFLYDLLFREWIKGQS